MDLFLDVLLVHTMLVGCILGMKYSKISLRECSAQKEKDGVGVYVATLKETVRKDWNTKC